MTRKPIQPNHPNPTVNIVQRSVCFLSEEEFLQGANLSQCLWVVEDQQILWEFVLIAPVYGIKPPIDLADRRRLQARFREENAQRVDVAAAWNPVQECGLD